MKFANLVLALALVLPFTVSANDGAATTTAPAQGAAVNADAGKTEKATTAAAPKAKKARRGKLSKQK